MSGSNKDYDAGSPEAAGLWRRFQAGRGPAAELETPDPLLLAAYVEGSLDDAARDRVEAWMAASPEAVDLVLAARTAPTDRLPAAPPELLARARGLVRPATVADARRRSIAEWLADTMQPGLWAATAAAMLFAAVLSFELGREASVNLAATDTLTVASADDDGWDVVPSVGDLL